MKSSLDYAETVLERCEALAEHTEEPGRLTRRFATPALRDASECVRAWMEAAGMVVRRDAIGNVIGRLAGPDSRTLLMGSHLDTVRDAGRYDGMLGVLVAIACVERLRDTAQELPYGIEVMAFADEEGIRFGTAYLGSSVIAGRFDLSALERRDSDGMTMKDALREFGGDPDQLAASRRSPKGLIGYYEVHIEQGPVLEAAHAPLGIVSAIAGQTRARVAFLGEAGHAGTVPMALRRDALCGAAEWLLATEDHARSVDGLVATCGELEVEPRAGNVIPARATLSLDVRAQDDAARERAVARFRDSAARIAHRRALEHEWHLVQETPAVACSSELGRTLAEAVGAAGHRKLTLSSGAGHDGAVVAAVTPVTMLFVRCAGGISHNPAEHVTVEDVGAAIEVSTRFLELLR